MAGGTSAQKSRLGLMNRRTLTGVIVLMALSFSTALAADKKNSPSTERELLEEILDELRAIRGIFDAASMPQQKAPTHVVTEVGTHWRGDQKAPIAIVEYTDLQCPYCSKFHKETWPLIKRDLVDTGKVVFYTHDFPLPMHPNAFPAAVADLCAGVFNKFWEARDWMASNPDKLDPENVGALLGDLGLDKEAMLGCMQDEASQNHVKHEIERGQAINVSGTPTFVIGRNVPAPGNLGEESMVIEGDVIQGAVPFKEFQQKVEALLSKQ